MPDEPPELLPEVPELPEDPPEEALAPEEPPEEDATSPEDDDEAPSSSVRGSSSRHDITSNPASVAAPNARSMLTALR